MLCSTMDWLALEGKRITWSGSPIYIQQLEEGWWLHRNSVIESSKAYLDLLLPSIRNLPKCQIQESKSTFFLQHLQSEPLKWLQALKSTTLSPTALSPSPSKTRFVHFLPDGQVWYELDFKWDQSWAQRAFSTRLWAASSNGRTCLCPYLRLS